jgi:hypothetical protein
MDPCRIEQRGQSTLRQLLPSPGNYPKSSNWRKSFRNAVTGFIDGDTVAELSASCV